MMILVTGAAGKTGRSVIRALAADGEPVRALVRRPEQAALVESLGARQVVVGDMLQPSTLAQAARGTRAVYHICPNVNPAEVDIGQVAISAARAAGVEHFVYHSVLHPQTEAMPHHWLKLRVEERLLESGLPCTILQPAAYMQNILARWDLITQAGIYRVPYGAATRLSMVDLEDVALAAARVLRDPGHVGATYELVGTQPMSQIEIAAVLSQETRRVVQTETMPLSEWEQQARSVGLGDYQVDALLKMFRYYERHEFGGNPQVLSWLLERRPTTFASFVRSHVRAESNDPVKNG
ncbi:MAG TPA: NmrA family NAD(P)-binding protein [Anaerolineae bacterium]|nr:NmrA family NAD(P)-binding protein [Anaerolineae bacterium]